jgi:spore cortex protein
MNKQIPFRTFYFGFIFKEDMPMKFLTFKLVLFASVLLFTGCGTYTDEGAQINRVNDGGAQIQNIHQEQRFNSYNETYRMRADKEVNEQVEMLKEVQSATVITTHRKAYAAVVLENGDTDGVPEDVRMKISEQIKSTDDTISEVYVSTNPDFVVRMKDYSEQLESGRPITGLAENFNATVEKVFPRAR